MLRARYLALAAPLLFACGDAASGGATAGSPSDTGAARDGGQGPTGSSAPGAGGSDPSTGSAGTTGAPGGTAGGDAGPTGGGSSGGGFPPAASGNPYDGARMYVNPDYAREVEAAAVASPADGALLRKVSGFSTAIWLDSIAKSKVVGGVLDAALAQQKTANQPVVTTFVIYDLPNRDCAANSSNGELTADNGGEARYKTDYIDAIAALFRSHPSQRIVALVEPDSLPNIATNLGIAKCAASEQVYRRSVAYAIATLALPNVSLYVDAAHAGWLGWDDNRAKVAQIYKDVLTAAGGLDKIRGFVTNVSNYNVLHGTDGQKLEPSNPCPDEATYVQKLGASLTAAGITNKAFVIDTSRDGQAGIRTKWGNWCNVKGAGLGERPRAAPAPGIDAYYWVKPPGESDGVSDPAAPRYDAMCSSPDSAPAAPQAGEWFGSYFIELAKNASPAL